MTEKKSRNKQFGSLRQRAEKLVKQNSTDISSLSREDIEVLVHELAVHQIELEVQNEDLRQTQAKLTEARDRYQDLYDNAPIGYINLDSHFIITDANLTFLNMTGCERSEVIKQGISHFLATESYPPFSRNIIKITTQWTNQPFPLRSPVSLETRIKRKNNTAPFYALLNIYPWRDAGSGKLNFRISATDISDLKQAESGLIKANAELEEKNQALEKYSRELEAANRELDAFAYSVSHDLRAPLRAIDGFSQFLQEDSAGKLDRNAEENLNRIRKGSQSMGKLIDGLLNLSRIIRQEMDIAPINLSEMASSIAERLQKEYPSQNLKFLIQPGLKASGDPALMHTMLQNLLENAVKFTSKQVEPVIEFGVTSNKEDRVYFVSDNGAGFNMAYADKLFKPFQRLHSTSEFPGLGIGLATIQRIISRHGGKIWAEGEVGKGARFFFTLNCSNL